MSGPRRSDWLFDPGWLFVLAGVVICAAWVLIPAKTEVDRLGDDLRRVELERDHIVARLEAHASFLDAMQAPDEAMIHRLAAAQRHLVPAGDTPVLVARHREASPSARLDAATPPPIDRPPLRMPSLLTQIVTGPARLWLLGAAIFSIFIGLVIGAPATARLEAGEEDGEAEWLDDRAEAVGSLADEAGADVDGEIETDHETDGAEDLEEVGAEDASGDPELLDDVEDAENEAVSSECGDEVELVDGEVEADEESEEEGEPEYVEPIDQHADEIDPEAIEEVDESAEEELDEGDPAEQPEDSIDGAEETSAEVLVEMKIGEIDPEPTGGLEGGVGWVEPKSIDPRRAKREKRRERRRRAAERRAARQHAKHGGISHEASGTEDEGDLD